MATRLDAELEVEWYTALYEEDCRQLLKLLNERESLWSKGWESDPERRVRGRPGNYWFPERTSEWKGRTALHVAARRGCVALIDRVVKLCKKESAHPNGRAQMSEEFKVQTSPSESAQSRPETPDSPLRSWGMVSDRPITNYMDTVVQREGFVFEAYIDDAKASPDFFPSLLRTDSDEEESSLASVLRGDTELSDNEDSSVASILPEETETGDDEYESSISLEKFLLTKDGRYKLDAFAMALVNGNPDVIVALLEASVGCPALRDRYRIQRSLSESDQTYQSTAQAADHRLLLTEITKAVIHGVGLSWERLLEEVILRRYARHRDFNFLPIEEYLFHFLLTRCRAKETRFLTGLGALQASLSVIDRVYKRLQTILVKKVMQAQLTTDFRCFLWELQDGQGRRPLHVSIDEDSFARTSQLLTKIMNSDEALVQRILNARDGGGRTAWQRGAALGKIPEFSYTTLLQMKSMTTPQVSSWWEGIWRNGTLHKIDADVVSSSNGLFAGRRTWIPASPDQGLQNSVLKRFGMHRIMPLHSAILLKQSSWIRNLAEGLEWSHQLLVLAYNENWLGQTICLPASSMTERDLRRTRRRSTAVHLEDSTRPGVPMDCVGLAAMVGDVPVLAAVLEIQRIMRRYIYGAAPKRTPNDAEVLPALHIAAASGNYDLLKMFINDPLFDPFVLDSTGNTALHCAAKGLSVQFGHHLIDFVNCEQILKTERDRWRDSDDRYSRQYLHDDCFRIEREGCINRLLQFGCDIWEMNADGEAPYPSSDMSYKFLSSWYVKQAKEFGANQKCLSFAANATSVTGALVATASFVGPLQPPGDIASELQMGNVWMKAFIVCDTMSFYMAIVAIIFSLVPTLPMPQQSMIDELRRTRRMVTLAVVTLFPSIIFVLISFGAAALDATQSDRISIGTAVAGGFMGLLAILLFSVRVLAFSFPKSKCIRKLYDRTSF